MFVFLTEVSIRGPVKRRLLVRTFTDLHFLIHFARFIHIRWIFKVFHTEIMIFLGHTQTAREKQGTLEKMKIHGLVLDQTTSTIKIRTGCVGTGRRTSGYLLMVTRSLRVLISN